MDMIADIYVGSSISFLYYTIDQYLCTLEQSQYTNIYSYTAVHILEMSKQSQNCQDSLTQGRV